MFRKARAVAVVVVLFSGSCGVEEAAIEGQPPGGGTSVQRRALTGPTLTLTLDLGGYAGPIVIGGLTAGLQGASFPIDLPSGQHEIFAPDTTDATGASPSLATLTVDAVAGTIALSPSSYFQPVAPGDRTLHLQTIVFPYDHDDTAFFSLGLAGVGWFSGGGGYHDLRVLDNRRYQLFLGFSWGLDGTPNTFDDSSDVGVRNGCAEVVPEGTGAALAFSVRNCRLRPDLTNVLVAPGTDVPVALMGVRTVFPGQPFKAFRNRVYRFVGPNSFDIQTGASEFSDRPDLIVSDKPDVVSFVPGTRAAQLFAVHNRMIVADKVTPVPFDANDSVTELAIVSDYPITQKTKLLRGRRYAVQGRRSWDPGDVVGQNFRDGFIGPNPGITLTEAGTLEATAEIKQRFDVRANPPRLVAKVGKVRFTVKGIRDKLMVDNTVLNNGDAHCGTKVLIDRIHQLTLVAPNGDWPGKTKFQFNADGTCAPTSFAIGTGTIQLECSR